ncbi:UNVERIFIED_CONTAM: hypothetical protein PYX00_010538 [Menopon gallinae]|uniref:Uncharacterized protein n=1 Tax=Menopon gallinae TaxID=328185 RepID=A0AAW2HFQ8_9NEOP
MFGSKFKTWMENHIVRPKRKNQHEKEKVNQTGGKGPILESSESLAHSDTGVSSGSQQVLSSSNTDNNEGYCTTTMESNRSGMAHCHTAVNLSSPESAYSTGYSTDGTSPGGTGPPEYYINIRTGKHYFPSPAPTPTSPQPTTAFSQLYPSVSHCITTSFLTNESGPSSIPSYPSQLSSLLSRDQTSSCLASSSFSSGFSPTLTPFVPGSRSKTSPRNDPPSFAANFSKSPAKKALPKSPLSTLKQFLKSPKQDKVKPKPDEGKTPTFQNKKKPASPLKNKKWYKQPFQKFGHRRTDSTDDGTLKSEVINKKDVQLERNLYFLKESASSPRQRNRIRTNPWLPTEPLSSQNFHNLQISFPPSLARNRSCTNTPLQNRKTDEVDALQNRLKDVAVKYDDPKDYLNGLEKAINRHIGQKLMLEVSDHSEEDLTLNEMMGTYNESYVYEKETDILSDSDPTDCEDYVSDSEADNGGDEDSHDDELDFIDNGSVVEGETFLKNTGKCMYYDIYAKKNHFLSKSSRHSRSESERKSLKRDADSKRKRAKDDKRKKSFRKSVRNAEPKRQPEGVKPEPVKVINMSKLLMQRANGKNGSKSADGTPVCLRRRKMIKELRETHIGDRKSTNPSLVSAVLEDDLEADRKYNQLILEAENMFVTMQNSPVIQARKKMADKDSLSIWKETESLCAPRFPEPKKVDVTPRKNLGLSLAVDSKKPCGKASFKAKSSAHSPLDPLGPTFKNFTVFRETDQKISSSSSDDSEANKPKNSEPRTPQNVVPIAFQSVDLGKPLTSYCPQSEPVKRKIYSCSKTYDKLVKRIESETNGATRHESFRKRSDSYRSVPYREGTPPRGYPPLPEGENVYNPAYSPYSSPVPRQKPCSRSDRPSPNFSRRRVSYDAVR